MKLRLFIFCVVSYSCLFSQSHTSEIKPLAGEKWYGGYTAKAICNTPLENLNFQPYLENESLIDLSRDNRGNQAAPLLVSSKGRYVWSDWPFAFEFEDGTLILHSDHEHLQAISAGKTLREAYLGAMKAHFPPSGKTPNPLMFKMPQYNTWIELGNDQSQEAILKYANDVLENRFPPGVFMIDDNWSKYYGNFEFERAAFPDPKNMVAQLHEKGFHIMLWVTPFISPDSREYRELARANALVLTADESRPALIHWWNGYSACLDLTKPAAVNWFREKLHGLQETYRIDGYKFDAADFDFYESDSPRYSNHATNTSGPVQAERYAQLGTEFDFNEFRASWKMGNQPLAQRLQDKGYSWDELKLLIPDMVSAGIIGHAFTCPDMIGGGLRSNFEDIDYSKFDQELMIRSAQIQALMPMMQFSVAPWRVLDPEHLEICREAAWLHARMGEHIYNLARLAANTGEPIVRHMEYVFPGQGFESSDDQFMLGDDILVAPIVGKSHSRTVKLPTGTWIDETGKRYKGGKTIDVEVPLARLAYFKRPGG